VILPVYAALQSQQQQAIFGKAPPNCRKVLFSTNICETSLTVDGIVYVIDSGFVKQKVFSAETGIESLLITPISQVQATQRTGRAGRTRPGKCYRLYTEKTFEHEMPKSTLPEIQRANLANTVLMLKEFGIVDVLAFPFLDPPSPGLLIEALQQLFWLDAIDLNGHLTDAGRRLASLPLEPALGSMLLLGGEYGCCAEMLTIAAMLSVENLLERPSERNEAELAEMRHKLFYSEHGDHVMLLAIYESWLAANCSHQWCSDNYFQARALDKAKSIRQQLEELLSKHVKTVASTARPDKVVKYCCKAIARCFFHHAARRTEQENKYKTLAPAGVNQCAAFIHPSSPLALTNPKWVTYAELTYTTRPYMRHVCAIDYEWIEKLVPKLQQADPRRLTGRAVLPKTLVSGVPEAVAAPVSVSEALAPQQQSAVDSSVLGKRRIDDAAEAARQRYLERKRAAGK
jgi:ATP-dependent RNA helicase DHX8/PRP22